MQAKAESGERTPATVESLSVERWRNGQRERIDDQIAVEAPIAITYQGVPYVVMMATPADLEDLARGFTLSEGLVASPDEIRSVEAINDAGALEVRVEIAPARFSELLRKRRNLTGRTGCGVCGAETIEQAIRRPSPVTGNLSVSVTELHEALNALKAAQSINDQTGATHAAAWAIPGRGVQIVREDVGRHNALDKVIGALLRERTDPASGYLLVTSRGSYELVQKAATVGVSLLVAVSAPTSLAIQVAHDTHLTLVAFARADRHVVYAHPERITQ
jgi:FdhD protein